MASSEACELRHLPLASIDTSGQNPRCTLGALDELAASIGEHGLLQPVVVRQTGTRFELIAGHRRVEALRSLGRESVPAIVRNADADEAYVLTLVENLQRTDLRPTEQAHALEALVRKYGWSTRQVAAAIKRSQAYVSKRLRVFEDPLLAPAILANQLSVSAAEELLAIGEDRRYELLSQAIEQGWDRQRVRSATHDQPAPQSPGRRPAGLTRRIHQFRLVIRDVKPDQFTEPDRRELRQLFSEVAFLARASTQRRKLVFPRLPAR
ncbi:MAG: ParB/RepB/Spo0J family partition protein [Chloroflexota bacterium]|nr:ParB/RepB/Spo0J family partition protein [Chloroflexota bacterium]